MFLGETNCFNLILILLMGKRYIIFLKRIILIIFNFVTNFIYNNYG